jgi:hypothetical protein
VFVVTVLWRDLPSELRLRLEAAGLTVLVTSRLSALSPQRTRLTSEEAFEFEGLFGKIMGVLARWAIHKAHRRNMTAFKRYAERVA